MNFEQIVLMLIKGFHQVVNQIRIQRRLADHDVPDPDGRNGVADTFVYAAGQIDSGVFLIGGHDFFLLGRCKGDDVNIMGGGQIQNGAGAGSYGPESHVDGAVP